MGPVDYFDFEKDDMTLPFGLVGRPGFVKRSCFAWEQEIRATVHDNKSGRFGPFTLSVRAVREFAQNVPVTLSVPAELDTLVQEIRVSPNAEDWFVELVERMARRVGLGDRVARSRLYGAPQF